MNIQLICVGSKMPHWVNEAYQNYLKRLPKTYQFNCIEIPFLDDKEKEADRILQLIPKHHQVIALVIAGKMWSSEQLAAQLQNWLLDSCPLTFLIGGPHGLSERCIQRAQYQWSLSQLTLPHGLARIVVIEQFYRATTILQNHPYHK